jgi:photosystem II stability/assembly factor-like uncharacterized protein
MAADWQTLTTDLVKREKPGYGGLSGVAIDRATGHIYVDLSDRGVYRSTDGGTKWEKHGDADIKGRTETPGCMYVDPTGRTKRILLPLVYGSPVGIGATDDNNWRFLHPKCEHVDWCAVDWSDDELKFALTLKHESGGLLLATTDGGQSFSEVGKGFGPAWVFDGKTAVAVKAGGDGVKKGIARTTDGGKTFEHVSDLAPTALPRWHDGTLYWLGDGVLVKTTDAGAHWEKVCELKDARTGPVFGKNSKQLFVLTGAGIRESADGGATWSQPIAVPEGLKGVNYLTWIDYDPVGSVLYVTKMGSDLYKLPRK